MSTADRYLRVHRIIAWFVRHSVIYGVISAVLIHTRVQGRALMRWNTEVGIHVSTRIRASHTRVIIPAGH